MFKEVQLSLRSLILFYLHHLSLTILFVKIELTCLSLIFSTSTELVLHPFLAL
jgi:hypothetical protein